MTSLPVKRGRSPARIPPSCYRVYIIIIYPYRSDYYFFCVFLSQFSCNIELVELSILRYKRHCLKHFSYCRDFFFILKLILSIYGKVKIRIVHIWFLRNNMLFKSGNCYGNPSYLSTYFAYSTIDSNFRDLRFFWFDIITTYRILLV